MQFKYIFLPIAVALMAAGCIRQLDIEPENSLTFKNGIKTEKDIESLIGEIDRTIRYAGRGMFFSEEHGNLVDEIDNVLIIDNHVKRRAIPPVHINAMIFYDVIQRANIPLNHLNQTDMTESRKAYYRGLCSFYKALSYLQLIRAWGDVVLVKDDVMLDPVAKSPWTDVADYAIAQAEEAVKLLPEFSGIRNAQGAPARNKFAPSKGAAYAVLAHLAAWKAGCKYLAQPASRSYDERALWKKAADACSAIITSGEYGLAPNPEAVCESVLVGDSRESIYEIAYRQFWEEYKIETNGGQGSYGVPSIHNVPNYGFAAIKSQRERWVADSIKKRFPVNDLRRYAWFYKLDSLSAPALHELTGGYAYPNKYRKTKFVTSGPLIGDFDGYDQNYVIYRLAEIYLLRAECRARLGEHTGAIDDLNIVRARAQATAYQAAEGDLRYIIFQELSKEMQFEANSNYKTATIRNGYVRIEPTLKKYGYNELTDQEMVDGALFNAYQAYELNKNPLLRQNIYWFKLLGR